MEYRDAKLAIEKEDMTDLQRDSFLEMMERYIEHLPESLYLSPYELEEKLGYTSSLWRKALGIPDIERQIMKEITEITEYASRKALLKLTDGTSDPKEVSGIKELLSRSEALNRMNKQRTIVVYSYLPKMEEAKQDDKKGTD
ncbi:hypothetical protein [Paenibacillus phage SV21]|nr:hypothetical protein [Paenibacillus phage SV21]